MLRRHTREGTRHVAVRWCRAVAVSATIACLLSACFVGSDTGGITALSQRDPATSSSPDQHYAPRSARASAAREVLVWSRFDDFSTHTARLVAADGNGAHAIPITHPPAGAVDVHPQVAPDGKSVLFERDLPGRSAVLVVSIRGHAEREIDLRCSAPCIAVREPAWTNDGAGVVYTRVLDSRGADAFPASASRFSVLWMSSLDGENQARLSEPRLERTFAESAAVFAPRGYLVTVRTHADGRTALFRLAANGRDARQLTPWSIGVGAPRVSPAASGASTDLVVFETSGSSRADAAADESMIATVPATCRTVADCSARVHYLTRPTRTTVQYFNPTWSPDGAHIAFAAATWDGTRASADIWTMNADGSDQRPASRDWRFELRPAWGAAGQDAH